MLTYQKFVLISDLPNDEFALKKILSANDDIYLLIILFIIQENNKMANKNTIKINIATDVELLINSI